MPKQHVKGPMVPEPSDPIVESISAMVDTMGIIQAVTNLEAARAQIRQAVAQGKQPTKSNPMFFHFNELIAIHDGATAGDVPVLRPASMIDWRTVQNTVSGRVTLSSGEMRKLCEAPLDPRPYQRVVFAIGSLWGSNSGSKPVDLEVRSNGIRGRSRLGQWDESTSAHCIGVIPAGVVADTSMWLRGAGGGSDVTVSADEWSRMSVIAFPSPAL